MSTTNIDRGLTNASRAWCQSDPIAPASKGYDWESYSEQCKECGEWHHAIVKHVCGQWYKEPERIQFDLPEAAFEDAK